ncbi:hypothetical protein JW926_02365, partial [Candidatus Sumerlaeota bacterium]|nr:hypothetical protein [Candidatus Sumerlaeota bacterium]
MRMIRKDLILFSGWIFSLLFMMITSSAISEPFSTSAEFDSGWRSISQGETLVLTHNLGEDPEDYVVYLEFYNDTHWDYVNQMFYGGGDLGTKSNGGTVNNHRMGAYWKNLTDATITVYRMPEDIYVEKARVRIWKYGSPNYDSGWVSLTPGATATILEHNKAWDPENYVVYMDCKNTTQGINQCYYGGNDFGSLSEGGSHENDRFGAYWRNLTSNAISIFRNAEDVFADNIRIRIWFRPVSTYDSGWVAISQSQQ